MPALDPPGPQAVVHCRAQPRSPWHPACTCCSKRGHDAVCPPGQRPPPPHAAHPLAERHHQGLSHGLVGRFLARLYRQHVPAQGGRGTDDDNASRVLTICDHSLCSRAPPSLRRPPRRPSMQAASSTTRRPPPTGPTTSPASAFSPSRAWQACSPMTPRPPVAAPPPPRRPTSTIPLGRVSPRCCKTARR